MYFFHEFVQEDCRNDLLRCNFNNILDTLKDLNLAEKAIMLLQAAECRCRILRLWGFGSVAEAELVILLL